MDFAQDVHGSYEWVDVSGNYVFVAAGGAGVIAVNIANPTNPQPAALSDVIVLVAPLYMRSAKVVGEYLLSSDDPAGFLLYDVTIPNAPVLVDTQHTAGAATDVDQTGRPCSLPIWREDWWFLPRIPSSSGNSSA